MEHIRDRAANWVEGRNFRLENEAAEIREHRLDLEALPTSRLWDRILARVMRTSTPELDADRTALIDWLIETECLGMNVYRFPTDDDR